MAFLLLLQARSVVLLILTSASACNATHELGELVWAKGKEVLGLRYIGKQFSYIRIGLRS